MTDGVRPSGPSATGHKSISSAHIVFFVVAAAAPMTAVLGTSTAAFAFGNGPGVPVVFLMIGGLYLLFSAGFTAMSPHVASAGGFYAYVTFGLGRRAGGAVAAVAVATYQAIAMSTYGLFGFFATQTLRTGLGWAPPWWIPTLLLAGVVHICGRRAVTFSGNVLAFCLLGEVSILLALGIAILAHHTGPFLAIASPSTIFGPGLGISIVFVVVSFIGFEATVIFGEEARHPARDIPRATYVAVILIALFYSFSTWTITLYHGPSAIKAAALADAGNLYLTPIRALLGWPAFVITQGLLLTSTFACILSFHATIARYLSGIAREGLCDARLGSLHPVHGSPHRAGLVQTLVSIAMVLISALLAIDPYAGMFAWAGAFASLGILAMQVLTSAAVFTFFRRTALPIGKGVSFIAPLTSAAALMAALVMATANLGLIAGTDSSAVFVMPVLLVLIAAAGWFYQPSSPDTALSLEA
ncbi:MAG: APC family permease [Novosphingobium sp.]|uniref:APC family permease n=1 Tax=Novosphingobium sp. TaxID=1874826 RepID=UPI0030160BE9